MHLWSHPSSKFKPREVRDIEDFKRNFGQQKMRENLMDLDFVSHS